MALDILLDSTGDLDFADDTFRITPTLESLTRQQIQVTLNTFKGEWVFDIFAGIPYLENENNPIQLLSKEGTKVAVDIAIRSAIIEKTNVQAITNYQSTLNRATRAMEVSFVADTVNGTIPFTGLAINI